MTDLRPLMGLRFECVSVSYSPGLDSKGLHQRRLPGGNGATARMFSSLPPYLPINQLIKF